jgi:hypothetical protein
VDRTADGLAGVVLVVEHHVGEPFVGVDVLQQRARDRRDIMYMYIRPAGVGIGWFGMMDQRGSSLRVIWLIWVTRFGTPLAPPRESSSSMYSWKSRSAFSTSGRFRPPFIRAGDDEQFLRTREGLIDGVLRKRCKSWSRYSSGEPGSGSPMTTQELR